jgi:hydroxymethylpyrimidine pyrophosphatase-like HAD family hydrolase
MKKRDFLRTMSQIIFVLLIIVSCKDKHNITNEVQIKNINSDVDENINYESILSIDINGIPYRDMTELFNQLKDELSVETDNTGDIIENNICEIHKIIMARDSIRIIYGLIKPNNSEMEYYRLRRTYFPNSNDPINGGCVISDIRYLEEYICNECNKERDKYKRILELK